METIAAASITATVTLGLAFIVQAFGLRRNGRSSAPAEVSPEYARIAAQNGTKIDAQRDVLQNILTEQQETTKAVVEVATVLRQNGRSR